MRTRTVEDEGADAGLSAQANRFPDRTAYHEIVLAET
jgi:hypothetical protein